MQPLRCPNCGGQVPWGRVVPVTSFQCAQCGIGLRLRERFIRATRLSAMALTASVLYFARLTAGGTTFLAITLIGTWILSAWLSPIRRRLFPPELELRGEFEGPLFGATPDVDDGDASFTDPDQFQNVRKRVERGKEIESCLTAEARRYHPVVSTM